MPKINIISFVFLSVFFIFISIGLASDKSYCASLLCLCVAIFFLLYIPVEKAKIKRLNSKYNNWALVEKCIKYSNFERLYDEYKDIDIVTKILKHKVFIGMTKEMLINSIGHPVDIKDQIKKTKIIEFYKYNRIAKNRFGLIVKLENDVVVEYENK